MIEANRKWDKYFIIRAGDRQWNELHRRLLADPAQKALLGTIVLNLDGEVLDRSPLELFLFLSKGNVWIDYCGAAMWYYPTVFGTVLSVARTARFNEFLKLQGIIADSPGLANSPDWFPPAGALNSNSPGGAYPYSRSLVTTQNLERLYSRFRRVPGVPMQDPISPDQPFVYSAFGIQVGKGWYFYAFADGDGNEGVPVDFYWQFIRSKLVKMTGVSPPGGNDPGGGYDPAPWPDPGTPPGTDPGDGGAAPAPALGLWDRLSPTGRTVTVGLGAAALAALVGVMGRRQS